MDTPPIGPFAPQGAAGHLVRPLRRLRAGGAQVLALAAGAGLGVGLPGIDGGPRIVSARVVEILGVVGVAVLGVISLVYSVLFLVVQWAAATFTPRLALFRREPLVWRVLACAIGLLAYCITALLAIGTRPEVSVTVPAAALVLTTLTLLLVRRLQVSAFRSIQLAHVLADTVEQAHRVVDSFYPDAVAERARRVPTPLPPVRRSVTWPGAAVTLEQIDLRRLVEAARAADSTVVLRVAVGATVYPGDPVADVHGGGDLPSWEVTRTLIGGRERSFHQDPVYPLRVLSDIGLRALSPAVNDPATAVQTLDAIGSLLLRLVTTELAAASVPDGRGSVRVVLCLPGWTEFLGTGLDEMCRAAVNSPMVLSRARDLLRRLSADAPDERRAPVVLRLAWVEQQLADRHPSFMHRPAG
ncbi:DUF2254 family protein [Kitasatospora sp. NPDC096128]|uniref:DUF2254 family protein n=1 Tax=Kitasatospora sp. NPDC096128 TaxID=3155547 RepID=UPI00332FC5F4